MIETVTVNRLTHLSSALDLFTDSLPADHTLITRQLYPPLPISGNRLVWGFHILLQAVKSGEDTLLCCRTKLSPREQIYTALKLENRKGAYTWEEKLNVYNYLQRERLLPACGESEIEDLIDEGRSTLGRVEKYASLGENVRQLVSKNLIDLKTALSIKNLPPDSIHKFIETCAGLSFSSRKKVLLRLSETVLRDSMSDEAAASLTERVCGSDDPAGEAERVRYPHLHELHKKFDDFMKVHLSTSGVNLTPPPSFEGSRFTVQFSFAGKKELQRKISTLNRIIEKSDELFRLLH